jgi:hypothetical protein
VQHGIEKVDLIAHGRQAISGSPQHNKETVTVRDEGVGLVESLQRWADAGAIWRVVLRTRDSVEISMLTCTGGEEVDRFRSEDPAVLSYVGERESSED